MNKDEYGEFVGVSDAYVAIITEDSDNAYITQTPERLAPVGEIAGEAETNNTATYYDNQPFNNYVSEGVTTLTCTFSNVPAKTYAKYTGKIYDESTGRVYDSGVPNPPDCALGFKYDMGVNGARYYWYLKGTFSGGAEEAASKSNNVDARTYQMTYTAVATIKKWEIDGKAVPLKRVFGDLANAAFDADGWFSAVQTPDTSEAPVAIAIVSSVPVDGATDVSRSAPVVITFNNPINSESVLLLNGTTGDPITATKSLDVTRKILTLTPSGNLAASTKHILVISGVVDAFGQSLTPQSRDFTTTS